MRSQPGIKKTRSPLQELNRLNTYNITREWTLLTQTERNLWNTFAIYRGISTKKDINKKISGHQIFIRENSLRSSLFGYGAIYNNPIHANPVLATPPPAIQLLSVVRNGVALEINHDYNVNQTTQGIILFLSRPIFQSNQSGYTKKKMIKFFTISGTQQECNAYYNSVFGLVPAVGNFLSYSIGLYDSTVDTYGALTHGIIEVL